MFGNESKPSKRYTYGCEPPIEGLAATIEQIERQHEYRNKLVEAEHARRAAVEAALRELYPHLITLDAEVNRLDTELKAARTQEKASNARARKRTQTDETRHALRRLRDQLATARAMLRDNRRTAFGSDQWKERQTSIEEAHGVRCRALRADSGLYWANYLTVEQGASSFRRGAPPKFWRRRKGGLVSVQIQNGMSVEEALSCTDTRFRLELTGTRNQKRIGKVWIRIGTVEGKRDPIWCIAPVVFHRPLPPDARIKWAQLFWHGESHRRFSWQLQLVLARDAWQLTDPRQASGGRVGINLSWRYMDDKSLRVARWAADDGETGEWTIPPHDLTRWEKVEELRSIRDRMFDDAKLRLRNWMAGRDLPEWFRERTVGLHSWRSAARMAGLVFSWSHNRIEGDAEIYRWLEGWQEGDHYQGWRRQDWHLKQWEDNMRQKSLRWREHHYRNLIADLRRRYRVAVIEDTKYVELAELPEVEDATGENLVARRHRFIAASSRLRELIREGFPETCTVEAENITQTCHICHEEDKFDAALELVRTCSRCGHTYDQDIRAAMNLLAGGVS